MLLHIGRKKVPHHTPNWADSATKNKQVSFALGTGGKTSQIQQQLETQIFICAAQGRETLITCKTSPVHTKILFYHPILNSPVNKKGRLCKLCLYHEPSKTNSPVDWPSHCNQRWPHWPVSVLLRLSLTKEHDTKSL